MLSKLLAKNNEKRHSPITDRWVLEELQASHSISDSSLEVANKVYNSKSTVFTPKSITTKTIINRTLAKITTKQITIEKGNI